MRRLATTALLLALATATALGAPRGTRELTAAPTTNPVQAENELPGTTAWSGPTKLRIVFRATPDSPPRVATLRCNPPRGTVPRPTAACRRLLSGGRALFAPTPPGTACTQIYGGPQVALVTGTLSGRRVWARFARRDGCETERWNRIAFLLPAG